MKSLALLGLLFGLAAAGTAQAAVVATQGFADIGKPTANTGDINTATSFTFGDLVTTSANTGELAGLPTQDFGSVSFNIGVPGGLTFTSAAFGTFTSTSIVEATNVAGAVGLYVLGEWTPGTFGSVPPGSYDSSFTIALTQTPASTGTISASASFAVPPAPPPGTPEPSTWAMMIIGFAGLGYAGLRASKKKSAALAA